MLKEYTYCGKTYHWREGEQPAGAVEVKRAAKPADKRAKAPADKKAR